MTLTIVTFVAALEFVYYLGPNCRHSLFSTLPGAMIAIGIWIAGFGRAQLLPEASFELQRHLWIDGRGDWTYAGVLPDRSGHSHRRGVECRADKTKCAIAEPASGIRASVRTGKARGNADSSGTIKYLSDESSRYKSTGGL